MKKNDVISGILKNIFSPRDEGENKDNSVKMLKRAILSLIIAVIVWFVIINIVNPTITVWMKVTKNNFIGEATLRQNGFVVVKKEEIPEMSVKLRGTRNELIECMEVIYADYDLTGINKAGVSKVPPKINVPAGVSIEKQNIFYNDIEVEFAYKKNIPVIIKQEGSDKEPDKLVKTEAEVKEIEIVGSNSELKMVDKCIVTVDVTGVEYSNSGMYYGQLVNSEGKIQENLGTIYAPNSNLLITNTVYDRKKVPVKTKLAPELEGTYVMECDSSSYSTEYVEIGVPEGEEPPAVVYAVLESDEKKSGEARFTIEEPEGMYVKDTYITAEMKLKKREEITGYVVVEITGIPENLTTSSTQVVHKMTYSTEEGYDKAVKASADASGCSEGKNILKIKFEDKNVTAVDSDEIEIVFTAK